MTARPLNSRLPGFVILGAVLVAAWVAYAAPLCSNPDANYYYGTALRIVRGEFLSSIEGVYSPLLSWLIASLVWLGAGFYSAFKIVTVFAFALLLLGSARLLRNLDASPIESALVIGLLAVHLFFFCVVIVSPDILTAAVTVWFYALLLEERSYRGFRSLVLLGMLAGVAYLAKALELPILLVSFVGIAVLRRWYGRATTGGAARETACLVVGCLIVSSPWIVAISLKYHFPLISAQQLIADGTLDPSRDSPISGVSTNGMAHHLDGVLRWAGGLPARVVLAVTLLSRVNGDILFGKEGWWVYVGLACLSVFRRLRRIGSFPRAATSLMIVIHTAIYLAVWGPYLRYYFPILPLVHAAFFDGAQIAFGGARDALSSRGIESPRSLTLLKLLFSAIIVQMIATTIRTVVTEWQSNPTTMSVVEAIAARPELTSHAGVITGTAKHPVPGLVSYQLHREYWVGLSTERRSGAQIRELLDRWNIDQIVWCGALPSVFAEVDGLVRHESFRAGNEDVYVFDVTPAVSRERTK